MIDVLTFDGLCVVAVIVFIDALLFARFGLFD